MTLNLRTLLALLAATAMTVGVAACDDKKDGPDVPPVEPGPDVVTPIEEQPLESWNFVDEHGRALILRGVNLAGTSKGPTGLPGTVADTEADAAHFTELGFNVVRYLIQWKNIEPAPGAYDLDHLADVRERLDFFENEGIYVILDMHQDIYGPRFGFNGAPDWAVRDDGIEYVRRPQWFTNYMTAAVKRAFDNFFDYENHADLQDAYVNMWKVTAEALGDHPAVIGFDMMNEPHPGSDMDFLEFGSDRATSPHVAFDAEKLGPFYQRLIDGLREINTDAYILYESRYGVPGDGGKCYVPKLEDPRPGNRRIFQAAHLYVLAVEASKVFNDAAASRIAKWEKERAYEQAANVTGLWLGEFGTFSDVVGHKEYMEEVIAITERLKMGYAAWSWDAFEFGVVGARDPETRRHAEGVTLDIIVRPYPRAFAGRPMNFGFDPATRTLTVEWAVDHGIQAPTEIFLATARWYQDGYNYDLNGLLPNQGMVEVDGDIMHITVTDPLVTTAKIVISPR